MDSQVWGAIVAATITALASLGAVTLSRRTPYRRQQLQAMRDEAELLAALPDSHPMRDHLSGVLESRLRGYTRLFNAEMERPESLGPSMVLAMAGTLTVYWAIISEWETFGKALREVVGGGPVTVEWQKLSAPVWLLGIGVALYVVGLLMLLRRMRHWRWAWAMRGDELLENLTWSHVLRAVRWLWRQAAVAARQAWLRLRRGARGTPTNDLPSDSDADA